MFRTLSKLLFAAALSLGCFAGSLFAAQPVPAAQPQQQYTALTTQSLPQMMQQAGLQVVSKSDAMGPFWWATDPQNGKAVLVEPYKMQGEQIEGIKMSVSLPMPAGGVTQQQFADINAKIKPYTLVHNVQANLLEIRILYNYKDSNARELKAWANKMVATLNEVTPLVNGNAVPVVNPVPAPAPIPAPAVNLAGTTWKGTENLGGFAALTFQFQANGQALMIDAQRTVQGTYVVNGNQVTINLGQYATYTGTLNGNAFTGTGQSAKQAPWNFSTSKVN